MQMKGDDLFPKATSWMNSSHGMLSGVTTDQSSPSTGLDSVGWSEIAAKVGIVNASPTRLLQLNTVLLYSCDCGSFNGLASALFGATAINQAAFAFPGTIFTMLKAGDASFEVDLNDEHGTVLLTDKLDKHVSRVTSQLMSEKTASGGKCKPSIHAPNVFASKSLEPRNKSHEKTRSSDQRRWKRDGERSLQAGRSGHLCSVWCRSHRF